MFLHEILRRDSTFYHQDLLLTKSKMVVAAILKLTLTAIARSLVHVFEHNFAYGFNAASHK